MILWFACTPDAAHTDVHTDADVHTDTDADTDAHTDAATAPAFATPPEAVDLDPDPAKVRVALTLAPLGDGVAFNGTIPGPTLRVRLGDTVSVSLTNDLGEPTTVHWHGLSVPWDADGVTWMQAPIAAGETREVSFVASHPGTFWYHPHFDGGVGQVSGGLFGAFVVEDPADPPVDVDAVLVLHQPPPAPGTDPHAAQLAPFLVNGLASPRWTVPPGSVVRARWINASETGYADLRGSPGTWIAGDQGLLPATRSPADGLVLAPGDRAEVIYQVSSAFDVTAAPWSLHGGPSWGDDQRLVAVQADPSAIPAWPAFPAPGTPPTPDTRAAADIVWVFSGDDAAWFINGERYPDVTVPEVALGATALLEVRNLSPTEHPFHLHGLRFEVLSVDGVAPPTMQWEDTLNVPIRSVVRLRVVADNPGDWMAHCHILPHAHDGMMTVLRVHE
jgi:FtsP/CotA-like multicopper oxidase with cupredoxin domain